MYRYTASDKSGSFFIRPRGRRSDSGLVTRVLDVLLGWLERSRQRRHLAELDDRLLRDIGVSRVDVDAEISRPFWRADA